MPPEQTQFVFDSYILLEEKLAKILESVPFSKENETTWSPELVTMFVEVGSLVDSLSRTIIGGNHKLTIVDFEKKIFRKYDMLGSNIVMYTYPIRSIKPFQDYRKKPTGWWFLYNKLKHNRLNHYKEANLANVVRAMGGLFLLLIRNPDEEFSKALFRRQWTRANGYVPEYVHKMRLDNPMIFWCDSPLFGGSDNPKFIPDDLSKIIPALTSSKFQRYFGRFNPE